MYTELMSSLFMAVAVLSGMHIQFRANGIITMTAQVIAVDEAGCV